MARSLGQIADEDFHALLDRARSGDERAFADLWRVFNPPLLRYLTGLTDREEARDLASTVWLEIVRGLERFEGDAVGFRSWLFTVGRLRAVDLWRSQGRRPRQAPEQEAHQVIGSAGDDPAVMMDRRWSTDAAVALIGTLPEDQAEVLLLRVVADLDVAAVASIMDKRPGTVRVLAHRGLRRLADQLNGQSYALAE